MKRICYILLLILPGLVFSQTTSLEVSVSKTTVEEGEVFTYQIIANEDCPITAPDFGELEVVGGPEKGYSSSSYTVNHVTTNQNQYSLTYYLRANKKGTYNIPPASMKCKLKKVNSGSSITIKAVSGGNASTPSQSNANYFFKITTDKNSVYVGEPFVLTLKYYSTRQPTQIETIEPGTASGLWRKDLNPNKLNYTMTQENIKGQRYYVLELKQELCIAERAGRITIDPYFSSLLISQDIFSTTREDGKSNSLTIDVKKLPVDTPQNFNGLVGKFNLNHTIDKTNLVEGQSLELNIEIIGTGNFNGFDEPKLTLPSGFTVIDPEITDETTPTAYGMKGSMTYKFIITTTKPGDYELKPFSFSYFDAGEKKIKELSIEPISIHVEEGDENHGVVTKGQRPVEIENTDIQFIHQHHGINVNPYEFVFGSLPYYILVILPPVLVLLVLLVKRKKQLITDDEKVENSKKSARKTAQKSLTKALQNLKSGDDKGALKLLQNSLFAYLMVKLDLSLSELSLKNITTSFDSKKIDAQIQVELSHVWKKIEMAQYAPISTQNLENTIHETQKLIDQLDEKI